MTPSQLKAIDKEAEAYAVKEYSRNPLPGHPDFDLHTVYSISYKAGYIANPGKLLSSAYDALDLAQAELRAMYKRVGINGSNVLDAIDSALSQLPEPPVKGLRLGDHGLTVEDAERWLIDEYEGEKVASVSFTEMTKLLHEYFIDATKAVSMEFERIKGLRWVNGFKMTNEILLKVFKKVSLLDLSDCEFEYGGSDEDMFINALNGGRVVDAISWDGNIFKMMNNDGSMSPLNPMVDGYEAAGIVTNGIENDGWISVEDAPLIIKNGNGWYCTDAGNKEFIAALPYIDKKKPGKYLWWIRHCVIENGSLCVVGDDDNEIAGWEVDGITHYKSIPAPPITK